jgi:sulfite reductase beta subunit-like hemoprotein
MRPAGCGNHQAADIGFRGFRARAEGKNVDAVAIYTGGRAGPDAQEGKQVMEFVLLDENLPQVVAKIIQCLEPEAGSQHDTPAAITDVTTGDVDEENPASV